MRFHLHKGIGLVEVVVGASIILASVVALTTSYNAYAAYSLRNSKNMQAALLMEEGLEAVKFIRDSGWTANIASLSTNTTYYLSWNGTRWTLTSTAQPYIDNTFLRTVTIANVNRNSGTSDISVSGTNDPNTKQMNVSVAYRTGQGTTTRSASTYITNLFDD